MKTLYVCMDSINGIPHAIFEDEEIAKKFIVTICNCSSEYYIIEIPLNLYIEVLTKNFKPYHVIISKEENMLKVKKGDISLFDRYSIISHGFNFDDNLVVNCFARDENHAIEIAKQKRLEILENNSWRN